ncbi:5-formyltetrahydrofolate cyclo-ligase [Bacillus sp. MRMR6]|uniref:5-formyltetrahydrofolate cyclo-ligase n=1 Tax=Bacillus sp. MRMR6 TaxID=1928617 RepID=UPI0009518188|nr:5-formyltetrahydrofolate cyclo-ligase [Bacillus sp. MRMR6]OLS41688.1 5-formyltetrahydrofolate cyclo-ligase [Bacillus sp. MRMR6]
MTSKQTVRQQIQTALNTLSKPLYEHYSYNIAKLLYNDDDWKCAKVIGITISRHPEVDTYQIIRKAWEMGKQVVTAKCHPQEKQLTFRTLCEFSQLESVFYGLFEPIEEVTREIQPEFIDLLIVPGLGFTREGYRIGFGGGYYDRLLTNYKGKTISLAFDSQIVTNLPIEKHDQPVSKIITNDEVIKIK